MFIRTTKYFCNRNRLLKLKNLFEKFDREEIIKMKEKEKWDKEELLDIVYHSCVFLDNELIEKVYTILSHNGWIGDMSVNDTVIYTCLCNNDIVSCFCWIYKYHDTDFRKIKLAIGSTVAAFKNHPYLEKVYRNFLNYLRDEWLPNEANTDSTEISEAICLMLHRLRSNRDINEFITTYGTKLKVTGLASLWWLQDVLDSDYASNLLKTKVGRDKLFDEILKNWDYVVECAFEKPDFLSQTGRWFFILKWYMKYRNYPFVEKGRIFFIINSILRNKSISEIKEILTVDINSPLARAHIKTVAMYMSPSKMERIFRLSENKRYDATWVLTCADHMNDNYEGVVLYEYIQSCGVDFFDGAIRNFGVGFNNERSSVFLGSYSMSYNDRYLYELYSAKGSNERGYSVEVDFDSFDDLIEDGLSNDEYEWMCPLYYVVYADKISEIKDGRIAKQLVRISGYLRDLHMNISISDCTDAELVNELKAAVFQELEEIAYLFKHKGGYDEDHIWRDWTLEKELRTMKCVRGESNNIVLSETATDVNGLYYRNYVTKKKIIVKDVAGGSSAEALKKVKKELIGENDGKKGYVFDRKD